MKLPTGIENHILLSSHDYFNLGHF